MKKSNPTGIAKAGLIVLAIVGAIGYFGAQADTTESTRTYSAPTSSQSTQTADTEATPVPETKAPAVTPPPTYTPPAPARSTCNPNYSGCVANSSYDLDCSDVGQQVKVIGNDEYGLDRDNDGYGCESY